MVKRSLRKRDHDPYWKEYPLIQREAIALKGDHLFLYKYISSNPTDDLYQLYSNSGYDARMFFNTINDLIGRGYLKILPVYFSIDYSARLRERFYMRNIQTPMFAESSA
ncbi:MAG: hypothetical protein ACTSRW_02870 [Candidatus Helarchaeota archaeon]